MKVYLILAVGLFGASAVAQQPQKSQTQGFMFGAGVEGDGITYDPDGSQPTKKTGSGGTVAMGYGFSQRWSVFGRITAATMDRGTSTHYTLDHFDLGGRVHFRGGAHAVVPFLEVGISSRMERQVVQDSTGANKNFDSRGDGAFIGGGMNVYFNKHWAMNTAYTVSGGSYTTFELGGVLQNVAQLQAVSHRFQVGLTWWPRT